MVTAWNLVCSERTVSEVRPACISGWLCGLHGGTRQSVYYTKGNVAPDVDGDRAEAGEGEAGQIMLPALHKEWAVMPLPPRYERSQVLHVRIEFGSCPPKVTC